MMTCKRYFFPVIPNQCLQTLMICTNLFPDEILPETQHIRETKAELTPLNRKEVGNNFVSSASPSLSVPRL